MFLAKKLLTALILPPTGPLLLALLGLWLAGSRSRRWRDGGRILALLSLSALLVLSLPLTGKWLSRSLEIHPPLPAAALRQAGAIVVLGGGSYFDAPEYGGDTINQASLERLRYGVRLHRDSGLPLLLTGGAPAGGRPEAASMQEALERDFGVRARWVEAASRDTAENASLSAPLLKAAGIRRIVLVSHAGHLPRAVPLFEAQGLEVAPAPTGFTTGAPDWSQDLIPGGGLGRSRAALHEYLGRLVNLLAERLR